VFIPEYTITPKTLKNISTLEYGKAVIENTTILPSWENQLKKEAVVRTVSGSLSLLGYSPDFQKVKAVVNNISTTPNQEVSHLIDAVDLLDSTSQRNEIDENDLKEINKALTKTGIYRNSKKEGKILPEEILAETVQLFDWLNGLDAKDTHPVVTAVIVKATLDLIEPFENLNDVTSNLITYLILRSSGYGFKDFISLESFYYNTRREYQQLVEQIDTKDPDYTEWIDYFTEGLASEISTISQKVKLLAKDTKVAKATGRVKVTKRQERIVEYLQDYGIIQNKDFKILFPEKSEDTVLRDLKTLIDMEIIQKIGSTKSSRYQLK